MACWNLGFLLLRHAIPTPPLACWSTLHELQLHPPNFPLPFTILSPRLYAPLAVGCFFFVILCYLALGTRSAYLAPLWRTPRTTPPLCGFLLAPPALRNEEKARILKGLTPNDQCMLSPRSGLPSILLFLVSGRVGDWFGLLEGGRDLSPHSAPLDLPFASHPSLPHFFENVTCACACAWS